MGVKKILGKVGSGIKNAAATVGRGVKGAVGALGDKIDDVRTNAAENRTKKNIIALIEKGKNNQLDLSTVKYEDREDLWTEEVIKAALSQTGSAPFDAKSQLKIYSDAYHFITNEYNFDICKTAVKTNGLALEYAKQFKYNEDICISAVIQNPAAIKYVPVTKQKIKCFIPETDKIEEQEFDMDKESFVYIVKVAIESANEIEDKENKLNACKAIADKLIDMPKDASAGLNEVKNDKEIVKEMIKVYPEYLIETKFNADPKFLFEMINVAKDATPEGEVTNIEFLKYSPLIIDSKSFDADFLLSVLESVPVGSTALLTLIINESTKNENFAEIYNKTLNNKDFMLKLIKINPDLFKLASDEMKNDIDVVNAAISKKKELISIVFPEIFNPKTKEFIKKTEEQINFEKLYIKELIKKDVEFLKYTNLAEDKAFMEDLIIEKPEILASTELNKDEKFVLDVFKECPGSYKFIPNELKIKPDFIKEAIAVNPNAFALILEEDKRIFSGENKRLSVVDELIFKEDKSIVDMIKASKPGDNLQESLKYCIRLQPKLYKELPKEYFEAEYFGKEHKDCLKIFVDEIFNSFKEAGDAKKDSPKELDELSEALTYINNDIIIAKDDEMKKQIEAEEKARKNAAAQERMKKEQEALKKRMREEQEKKEQAAAKKRLDEQLDKLKNRGERTKWQSKNIKIG